MQLLLICAYINWQVECLDVQWVTLLYPSCVSGHDISGLSRIICGFKFLPPTYCRENLGQRRLDHVSHMFYTEKQI